MSLPIYQKIDDLIRQARHILLLTDERIDGDTMGSTMGLYHTLKELGKKVEVFSPKPLPQTFAYLPSVEVVRRDAEVFDQESIDLLIICDCSDGVYIKNFLPRMKHKVPLVSFDHHATNPRYGTINVVEEKAASSADVVWRFAKAMGYPVDANAAQCFLTGILTDTVVFSTPNTTVDAIGASAELVKLGASLPTIVKHNMMNASVAALKLWGIAFARLFPDQTFGGIATALTEKDIAETGANEDDASVISGLLHAMLEPHHEVVVVYRETKDGAVKGSTRSRGKNVAEIAERLFGGGGHKLAAGFKIPNARLSPHPDGTWGITKVDFSPKIS